MNDEASSEVDAVAKKASRKTSPSKNAEVKKADAKKADVKKSGAKKNGAKKDAPEESPEERWKANFKTIAGAVALALFIRIVLFEAFEIDGPSMEPTLFDGDRVVVAKYMYGLFLPFTHEAVFTWGVPDPGDVVIVHSPADNIDIVKRVIGVPGDVIEMRDNVVYRNGESIQVSIDGPCRTVAGNEDHDCIWVQEHVGDHTWHTSRSQFAIPDSLDGQEVPPGHILVFGDHRDRSNDSRNPAVGMIPISRIKGRSLAIYWSSSSGGWQWDRIFTGID